MRRREKSEHFMSLRDQGYQADEAYELAELVPQCRYLLPFPASIKFYVADAHAAGNEYQALCMRNFPANLPCADETLLWKLRVISAAAGKFLGDVSMANSCVWQYRNFPDYFPGGWTKERASAQWYDLCAMDLEGFTGEEPWVVRKCFIKGNEVLGKEKSRVIQASSDRIAMLQSLTCKMFAEALFHQSAFEAASIKHVGMQELPLRMQKNFSRFIGVSGRRGLFLSIDYKSYDSYLVNPKRECTECEGLQAYLAGIHAVGPIATVALRDRKKKKLRLKGKHYRVKAEEFGRESGDGGTSTMNYFVNLVFSVGLDMYLARVTGGDEGGALAEPEAAWTRRIDETSWVSSMHEGDDTVLAFSRKLVRKVGGRAALMGHVLEYYRKLGMVIEPAVAAGVTFGPEALQEVDGRIEFISRLWDLRDTAFSVPLLAKTIRSASTTFSRLPLAAASYMNGMSGMYNCASSPLLFSIYAYLARRGAKPTSMSWEGYKGRMMQSWLGDDDPETKVRQLRQLVNHLDDRARRTYERDHPTLTVQCQLDYEMRLEALASQPDDGSWVEVAGLLRELLQCC